MNIRLCKEFRSWTLSVFLIHRIADQYELEIVIQYKSEELFFGSI